MPIGLFNLEDYLIREFGKEYGLQESLALSIQFSRTKSPKQKKAIKALAGSAKTVIDYIRNFRGGLNDQVLNDIGYAYQVYLVPKLVNQKKSADASIEFIHFDAADAIEKEKLDKLNVLIKEKHVPVVNLIDKAAGQVGEGSFICPFLLYLKYIIIRWLGSISEFGHREIARVPKTPNKNFVYMIKRTKIMCIPMLGLTS